MPTLFPSPRLTPITNDGNKQYGYVEVNSLRERRRIIFFIETVLHMEATAALARDTNAEGAPENKVERSGHKW